MDASGRLRLSRGNDDYAIYSGGRNINITDLLNMMLFDDVYLYIEDTYTGEELIEVSGELLKKKVEPCYYLFHIDDVDIDSILWNSVGSNLKVDLKNVTVE